MSKNHRFAAAVVVFSAFAVAAPAASAAAVQGRGHEKKAEKKAHKIDKKIDKIEKKADKADEKRDRKDDARDAQVVVVDRDGHVRVFREYRGSLPPGLAKRESLPPGLRKQLRERGELPPGLQKRLVPVPAPWMSRLPPLPPYYTRYFVGDDFIVVDTRTNRIVTLVHDVWR
ncbi:MAG: hypothetical protein LC753_19985 [Acidobacteria bacterium]|nr:hypothetical protein [Acidobacteriota bacterium]